jgi:sec-independent protein translocase protein TatB
VFNLQGGELIIIALLALVVLGPEKLPEAARWFGRMYAQVRRMGDGFTKEFQSAVKEPLDDLRSAVSDPVKDLKTSLDETIASSAPDGQNDHTTPPETTTTESEETAVASPPPAQADDEGLSSS